MDGQLINILHKYSSRCFLIGFLNDDVMKTHSPALVSQNKQNSNSYDYNDSEMFSNKTKLQKKKKEKDLKKYLRQRSLLRDKFQTTIHTFISLLTIYLYKHEKN